MNIIGYTSLYRNGQIMVPVEIIRKNNLDENTIIKWIETDKGEYNVSFRKKHDVNELIGLYSTDKPTNSVKLIRELRK